MENRNKSIYNLAIKKKSSSPIQNKNMQTTIENGDNKSLQKNIFNGQILQKIQNIQHVRPYNLVGKKQVKSYFNKNTKKKYGLRRLDSAVSYSKQSNTVFSQDTDHNLYLTRQDLLDTVNKSPQQQIFKKNFPTLEKAKLKYKKYRNIWNQCLSHSSQNKYRTKIYDLVDQIRKKFEIKQLASLKQKKQNIHVSKWNQTLRYPFDLSHYYEDNFVQKIQKNGMCIKGMSKKNKQVQWVTRQRNLVFQFYQKQHKDHMIKSVQKDRKVQTKLKFALNVKS